MFTPRPDRALLALITAGMVAVVLVVDPRGDFPLSDDWSYAHAAKSLCEGRGLDLLPWTGASTVLQAAYGALTCKLWGFSFLGLRLSTLVLALSALWAVTILARQLDLSRAATAAAIATLGLNPLFVNLSFSFMTDIPFLALVLWASCLYTAGLDKRRSDLLLAGSLVAALAILIRQHAILVAAAAALVAVMSTGRHNKERFAAILSTAGFPMLVLLGLTASMLGGDGLPAGLSNKLGEMFSAGPVGLANTGFRTMAYVGLFLVPITIGLGRRGLSMRDMRRGATAAAVLGLTALFLYWRESALMPYLTDVVYDFGVGARTLRDELFLGHGPPVAAGDLMWMPITALALVSAAALLPPAWTCVAAPAGAGKRYLALAACLLWAGSLAHGAFYFDRYLLPVLPLLTLALLGSRPLERVGPGLVVPLALMGLFSVAGTHDHMAFNRARYTALDGLMNNGVAATEIDGGMDFNGWHLAAKLGTWPATDDVRPGRPASEKSWWWVVDDRYVASSRPLEGYRVEHRAGYTRWLPPGRAEVLILRRTDVGRDSAARAG